MDKGRMKLRLNNQEETLSICMSMKKSGELQSISIITYKSLGCIRGVD